MADWDTGLSKFRQIDDKATQGIREMELMVSHYLVTELFKCAVGYGPTSLVKRQCPAMNLQSSGPSNYEKNSVNLNHFTQNATQMDHNNT